MDRESALYAAQLRLLLDRLCKALDGLDAMQLNWRPPAPDSNSVYVLATHVTASAEQWVLGRICGEDVQRDRPAEFEAAGTDAAPLIARAQDLAGRFDAALAALPPGTLDETREFPPPPSDMGAVRALTVREALMLAVDHFTTHMGHVDLTRDLALADAAGG